MKSIKVIWLLITKEWKHFFYTPFGMVLVPLFLLISGIFFYAKLDTYMQLANPTAGALKVQGLTINDHILVPFYQDLMNVFIFFIPLITMSSFSEEKKHGTYDLLISYPIKPHQLLLGKYFGCLSFVLFLIFTTLPFLALLYIFGQPSMLQVFSIYLGILLSVLLTVAVGVVASLLTENQFIAALVTYLVYFGSMIFSWFAHISSAPWDKFFAHFLFIAHLNSFRNGIIFVGDIAVFLVATLVFLFWGLDILRKHYI